MQYTQPFDNSTTNSNAADLDIPVFLLRGVGGKEFHALANIFPLLDGKEFDELVASVKAKGLREPIVLHDGKIIDGRNRARACERAGVEPLYIQLKDNNALQFVLDKNLHRRHLSESQRAMIATKIANMRQGERTDLEPCANLQKVDRATAAAMLNVSERSIASATKVEAEGAPELVQAVERGEISVSAAAEIVELPAAEQRDLVANGNKEVAKAATIIRAERKKKDRPPTTSREQRRQSQIDQARRFADELATRNPQLARDLYEILYQDDRRVLHSLCCALGRKLGLDDDADDDSTFSAPVSP